MLQTEEHTKKIHEDSSDSDDSTESTCSIEQPPSMKCRRFEAYASLKEKISTFIKLFDRDYSELQNQINKLTEITDRVEDIHRKATIGSISGGVIGAVGGITSTVGAALVPFTLGASIAVMGMGAIVSGVGSVTGAASSLTDMISLKVSFKQMEKILKEVQNKILPIIDALTEVQSQQKQIDHRILIEQQATIRLPAGISEQEFLHLSKICDSVILIDAAYITNIVTLLQEAKGLVKVLLQEIAESSGKVAAQASKSVKSAAAFTGVLSGLFVALDIYSIKKDAEKLKEIDNQQKDSTSSTVRLIHKMRETVKSLQQTLNQLKKMKEELQPVRRRG